MISRIHPADIRQLVKAKHFNNINPRLISIFCYYNVKTLIPPAQYVEIRIFSSEE